MTAPSLLHALSAAYPFSRLVRSPSGGLWQVVIGLEVHVQISSRSKLFSAASADLKPTTLSNSMATWYDAAHPGTLPILNRGCIDALVRTGFALNATLRQISRFERKHYFYSDLPPGYQITQLSDPTVLDGHMEFHVPLRDKMIGGVSAHMSSSPKNSPPGAAAAAHDEQVQTAVPVLNSIIAAMSRKKAGAFPASTKEAGAEKASLPFISSSPKTGSTANAAEESGAEREKEEDEEGGAAFSSVYSFDAGKRTPQYTIPRRVRIERVQLEQDSGKSVLMGSPFFSAPAGAVKSSSARLMGGSEEAEDDGSYSEEAEEGAFGGPKKIIGRLGSSKSGSDRSSSTGIDLNRAGVGLLEIVTAPDFRSADEATCFLRSLLALLRATGASDVAIEEGAVRCDVNVSLQALTVEQGKGLERGLLDAISTSAKEETRKISSRESGGTIKSEAGNDVPMLLDSTEKMPVEAVARNGLHINVLDGIVYELTADTDAHGRSGTQSSLQAKLTQGEGRVSAATRPHLGGSWTPRIRPSLDEASGALATMSMSASSSCPPQLADLSKHHFGRVELKNVVSIWGVEKAIETEIARQLQILEEGGGKTLPAPRPPTPSLCGRDDAPPATRINEAAAFFAPVHGSIEKETRAFDVAKSISRRMRGKEDAADYRFMNDPDILPLVLGAAYLQQQADALPVLPDTLIRRLVLEHGLTQYSAGVLVHAGTLPDALACSREVDGVKTAAAAATTTSEIRENELFRQEIPDTIIKYYEQSLLSAVKAAYPGDFLSVGLQKEASTSSLGHALLVTQPRPSSLHATAVPLAPLPIRIQKLCRSVNNWLMSDLLGKIAELPSYKQEGGAPQQLKRASLDPERFGALVALVEKGTISGKAGKQLLHDLLVEGSPEHPSSLARQKGYLQLNDRAALEALVKAALEDPQNATSLEKYKAGHERVLGVFVGKVLAASGGAANPALVSQILTDVLGPPPKRRK